MIPKLTFPVCPFDNLMNLVLLLLTLSFPHPKSSTIVLSSVLRPPAFVSPCYVWYVLPSLTLTNYSWGLL